MKTSWIRLKPKEDKRIMAGHSWVFSNEVAGIEGTPAVGEIVGVKSGAGKSLGFGFYNPKTLISVRIFSRENEEVNDSFFVRRIQSALELRNRLFNTPFYRLVYGESDFLPGLIIDRFGDLFSVQTLSAAMDMRMGSIVQSINELFAPAAIYERNESPTRELEGLEKRKSILCGESRSSDYDEEGVTFRINPYEGQKTGFYFDQRLNRVFSRKFAGGSKVLDLFSNEGGFALNLARGGAEGVIAVESSHLAVDAMMVNAQLNSLANVKAETRDVDDFLSSAISKGDVFDCVVCDPPSFTRNRKSVTAAKVGYRRLHEKLFAVLRPHGILLTSSCSHHIFRETFEEIIAEAAGRTGRTLQLLNRAGASPDHPVIPLMPETEYLKFAAYRVA